MAWGALLFFPLSASVSAPLGPRDSDKRRIGPAGWVSRKPNSVAGSVIFFRGLARINGGNTAKGGKPAHSRLDTGRSRQTSSPRHQLSWWSWRRDRRFELVYRPARGTETSDGNRWCCPPVIPVHDPRGIRGSVQVRAGRQGRGAVPGVPGMRTASRRTVE